VRDVLPQLSVGRWLSPKDALAQVVEEGARLRGYLEEAELWRVAPGATGRFIADDPMRAAIPVVLTDIDANGVAYLDQEALTSDHHGPIAVRRDENQRPAPVQAQYGVRLRSAQPIATPINRCAAWWCCKGAASRCWAWPGAEPRPWACGKADSDGAHRSHVGSGPPAQTSADVHRSGAVVPLIRPHHCL
jgi:hypothetical protein